MQIFLSHSSKQKPLIREVKSYLPDYLGSWIDEEKLLFGDHISATIESTIRSETDYVLLFIDHHAARSGWVSKELEWTFQAEKKHGRTILLPVVIDEEALPEIGNIEIQNRKHLRLRDYTESSVRGLAGSIASDLFALLCRDMERLRKPKTRTTTATIADADTLLHAQAALIQKAAFPHRKANPLPVDRLHEVVASQGNEPMTSDELEAILSSVLRRNLIPGLVYDGFSIWLFEEHASWKGEMHHQKKERIGRKAASMIQNGMSVLLDAGSTITEIVRPMCKRIESRGLTKITVATTSINIADLISNCCVTMGFDDDFSAVRLYLPGGEVRPSTQAIVATEQQSESQIAHLADHLGGFDLAFVGVNGIDVAGGFTTHNNAEVVNKREMVRCARTRIVIGDSSKIGISLECQFADFDSDVCLMIDDDPASRALCEALGARAARVILV